ncbi:MAG: hypothetical protein FWB86_01890 [Treponema sp.]|nr:hypothetical protein [Treponema sp.]MCL2250911.1 hypothetical protein [Treponema sp.]
MKNSNSVYNESTSYSFRKTFYTPCLRPVLFTCLSKIFYNFFIRQHIAAFLPGRIPISKVDHQLDEKIPFTPSWIYIYFDFVQFWVRMVSFFLHNYKRKAYSVVKEIMLSMGNLYAFAAEVYTKHLSTTKRPFYIARPIFLLIHLVDPHLMCIPSLHVMVAIHGYTKFKEISKRLGDEEKLKDQAEIMKRGALAICQAILFVKQHSINCIPAALYAMTCYTPDLFPPEEAAYFTKHLFSPPPEKKDIYKGNRVHPAYAPLTKIKEEDQEQIKNRIMTLYNQFLDEGKTSASWKDPILCFLRSFNRV